MGIEQVPPPIHFNFLSFQFSVVKMFSIVLFCFITLASANNCKVDSEVKFILNNMTPTAVKKNVDCVVGSGPCDSLGSRLKSEAGNAVRQGRCGSSCSCEQIQVRLVVRKVRNNYPSEWQRVVKYHGTIIKLK